jgi:hypothetical protein
VASEPFGAASGTATEMDSEAEGVVDDEADVQAVVDALDVANAVGVEDAAGAASAGDAGDAVVVEALAEASEEESLPRH